MRSLRAAAGEVEAALLARDLARLSAAVQAQMELVQTQQGLGFPLPLEPGAAPEQLPAEVASVQAELAAAVWELRAQQERNRLLLEDALAHTVFVLSALTGAGPELGVYGGDGRRPPAAQGQPSLRVVDRRA